MKTTDRKRQQDSFLTIHKLSENQSLTPEGFLLCLGAGLARTGRMDYGPGEVPDEVWSSAAAGGRVTIDRLADDVFAPAFLASVNGKSLVVYHPEDDVSPSNWKNLEVGIVLNARRGDGLDADLMIGDILVKDKTAIDQVQSGEIRELSVGYDADYQEYEPGKWKQVPLVANHVALVPSGRCGPRCAIHDHQGETLMKTRDDNLRLKARDRKAWYLDWSDRLRKAMKANDAKVIDDIMSEAEPDADDAAATSGEGDVHVHVPASGATRDEEAHGRLDGHDAQLTAHDADIEAIKKHVNFPSDDSAASDPGDDTDPTIEGDLQMEAPPGTTNDSITKAKDSALFADSFQSVIAGAEILVPGMTMPKFTKDAAPKKTFDAICGLRRRALDLASATADTKAIVQEVHGRELDLDKMSCGAVRLLFNSVVAMKKRANTNDTSRTQSRDHTAAGVVLNKGPIKSVADLNKFNREHYNQPAK